MRRARGGRAGGGVGALLLGTEGGVVGRTSERLLEGIGLEVEVAPLWLGGRTLLAVGVVGGEGVGGRGRGVGGGGVVWDDVGRGILAVAGAVRTGSKGWRAHDVLRAREATRERMTTRAES